MPKLRRKIAPHSRLICSASSRAGAITNAKGSGTSVTCKGRVSSPTARSGPRKPNVFPEAVSAFTMTSHPLIHAGQHCFCTSVKLVKHFAFAKPRKQFGTLGSSRLTKALVAGTVPTFSFTSKQRFKGGRVFVLFELVLVFRIDLLRFFLRFALFLSEFFTNLCAATSLSRRNAPRF